MEVLVFNGMIEFFIGMAAVVAAGAAAVVAYFTASYLRSLRHESQQRYLVAVADTAVHDAEARLTDDEAKRMHATGVVQRAAAAAHIPLDNDTAVVLVHGTLKQIKLRNTAAIAAEIKKERQ